MLPYRTLKKRDLSRSLKNLSLIGLFVTSQKTVKVQRNEAHVKPTITESGSHT